MFQPLLAPLSLTRVGISLPYAGNRYAACFCGVFESPQTRMIDTIPKRVTIRLQSLSILKNSRRDISRLDNDDTLGILLMLFLVADVMSNKTMTIHIARV